jgi:hypothetical protein
MSKSKEQEKKKAELDKATKEWHKNAYGNNSERAKVINEYRKLVGLDKLAK